MQIKIYKTKKGVTLIEAVVYITLLSLLTVATVTSLMLTNQSLQRVVLGRIVNDAAQEVMEKIVREIRFANQVNLLESSNFGNNPSVLVLDSTDVNGTPVKVEFSINSNILEFKRDDVLVGNLTPNQVANTELVFDHITTSQNTEAVKVSLVLEAQRGTIQISETFNTTVILRGSY